MTGNGPSRDSYNGRFEEEYPHEDFLDVLREIGPETTSDVADQVGCHRNLARRKLGELEERGEVTKQEFGRAFIWDVDS